MNSFQYIAAGEDGFKGDMLDKLLAAGFYRMQHLMFTCNDTIISEDFKVIPVFWLRTLVKHCKPGRSANNILKKCAGFSVNIGQACVDDEIESLYTLYKRRTPFTVSSTCAEYLHQQSVPQPFDSMMVQVRYNNKLIATGFFDRGIRAIAGIMNIYHPEYNSYSLGKFLMLQKLRYALAANMLFYYTGYISTESTRFDYKVFPDPASVEVFLPVEQEWAPYHLLNKPFLAEYYSKFLVSN
jgi:arginyl-tRNA--protein-N-Asp/Glu arginylyltransferase